MAFDLHAMPAAYSDRPTRAAGFRPGQGALTWREAGRGPALVLLHGIGSGAASFAGQLAGLSDTHRVIAWDAPGYGESAPLPNPRPMAVDYADALSQLLDHLGIGELVLVGHSLGALVAAEWAARNGQRVQRLVLASPARGYGTATAEARATKWQERIDLIEQLGVEGLAASRSAGLCAPHASPAAIASVRQNMARVTPGGYAQAAHLLANGDLAASLRGVHAPLTVLCGEHDRVTPPAACRELAKAAGAPCHELPGVGHACYVEDAGQFNRALRAALTPGETA
jgi:pimeloyl-ACP methyl ester carboxylesterase